MALTGPNGAGKTNLLEALSLLTPGRGLRRADLTRHGPCRRRRLLRRGGRGRRGARAGASGHRPRRRAEPGPRKIRIERQPASSPAAFADHLRVVWLTPAMDGLFAGSAGSAGASSTGSGAGGRCRPSAAGSTPWRGRLRGRNRLLEERAGDARWLDAAEREVAELAIAVARRGPTRCGAWPG